MEYKRGIRIVDANPTRQVNIWEACATWSQENKSASVFNVIPSKDADLKQFLNVGANGVFLLHINNIEDEHGNPLPKSIVEINELNPNAPIILYAGGDITIATCTDEKIELKQAGRSWVFIPADSSSFGVIERGIRADNTAKLNLTKAFELQNEEVLDKRKFIETITGFNPILESKLEQLHNEFWKGTDPLKVMELRKKLKIDQELIK